MDILHTGRFDGFVLVSSDSDFTALANRVREQGMDVIGIGEAKAPESLRNVCNRFILIENIVDEPAPVGGCHQTRRQKADPVAGDPADSRRDGADRPGRRMVFRWVRFGQHVQAMKPPTSTRGPTESASFPI